MRRDELRERIEYSQGSLGQRQGTSEVGCCSVDRSAFSKHSLTLAEEPPSGFGRNLSENGLVLRQDELLRLPMVFSLSLHEMSLKNGKHAI